MYDLPHTNKSLGQHWLQDYDSLLAMLEGVDLGLEDTVLEIGPGPGTLTEMLVDNCKQVVAVEFDKKLALDLPSRVPAKNLKVLNQDILSFDLTSLPVGYKVVANIPYYLTSNLLRNLCESSNPFDQATLLIQKEVAQRVCATKGATSLLSISVQYYCEATLGRLVPAHLFQPAPKVDSQILMLKYRAKPLFDDVDTKKFFQLVRAGFSQRRKTLLNSLSAGLRLERNTVNTLISEAGLKPSMRAQELDMDDWYKLYQCYNSK